MEGKIAKRIRLLKPIPDGISVAERRASFRLSHIHIRASDASVGALTSLAALGGDNVVSHITNPASQYEQDLPRRRASILEEVQGLGTRQNTSTSYQLDSQRSDHLVTAGRRSRVRRLRNENKRDESSQNRNGESEAAQLKVGIGNGGNEKPPPNINTAEGEGEERDPSQLLSEARAIAKRTLAERDEEHLKIFGRPRPANGVLDSSAEQGLALITLKKIEEPGAVINAAEIARTVVTRDTITGALRQLAAGQLKTLPAFADVQPADAEFIVTEEYPGLVDKIRAKLSSKLQGLVDSGIIEDEFQERIQVLRVARVMAKTSGRTIDEIYANDNLYRQAYQDAYGSVESYIDARSALIHERDYSGVVLNTLKAEYIHGKKNQGDRRGELDIEVEFWGHVYPDRNGEMRPDIELTVMKRGYELMRAEQLSVGIRSRTIWGDSAVSALPATVQTWLDGRPDEATRRKIVKDSEGIADRMLRRGMPIQTKQIE